MMYVDRILFATDGSDCAEQARGHAVQLAERFDASLHVVHVEVRDADLTDVIDVRETDILADLHGRNDGPPPMAEPRMQKRTIVHPSAPGGILSYAVEHDAQLIVLGTHGRRGVRRLVLGSVAEEVVRKAPCPVCTVGRGATPPESLQGGTLLVPIDFSDHRARLEAHARELAKAYDMTLVLCHVIELKGLPDVYGVYATPPEAGVLKDRTTEVMEKRADTLREVGVDVRVEVRTGHPATEILDAVDDLGANLLAIATHGRSGIDRMLMGSVAERVLRRAPCPVFTVKSFGTSLVASSSDSATFNDDSA